MQCSITRRTGNGTFHRAAISHPNLTCRRSTSGSAVFSSATPMSSSAAKTVVAPNPCKSPATKASSPAPVQVLAVQAVQATQQVLQRPVHRAVEPALLQEAASPDRARRKVAPDQPGPQCRPRVPAWSPRKPTRDRQSRFPRSPLAAHVRILQTGSRTYHVTTACLRSPPPAPSAPPPVHHPVAPI